MPDARRAQDCSPDLLDALMVIKDEDGQETFVAETPGGQKVTLKDGPGQVLIEDSNGNSVSRAGLSSPSRHSWLWQNGPAAGCSKRLSSKAAGESKPEAYPLGYVEDFDEPRTKLEAVFNIRLVLKDLWFRVRRLRINLRLRIPLIKHQHIPH